MHQVRSAAATNFFLRHATRSNWLITRALRWVRTRTRGHRGARRVLGRVERMLPFTHGTLFRKARLQRASLELIAASGLFDRNWYLDCNPDVRAAGVDPLAHYLSHGAAEGRDPSASFSTLSYLANNPDVAAAGINPLAHYLRHGAREGRNPLAERDLLHRCLSEYRHSVAVSLGKRDVAYASIAFSKIERRHDTFKPIAFYLPQMHPIAENDRAWGRGFTEWTNVSKATPQFSGHYQPKLPGELGFYDLRQPEVMYRQIELAKLYGLYGFCFHYYWFNGLRLLERPLDMFLNDRSMDFKFCLCWANENWTRNWDGDYHEVLLAQQHSTKDHERIFEDLLKYMRDERYIRINGRPLIVIYRPDIISELEALVKIWRQKAMGVGLPGIYLAATNAFAFKSAGKFGFDAICEFPPHGLQVAPVDTTKSRLNADFSGVVHRYEDVVAKELQKLEALPSGDVPTFPGVMPAWDNEARRPGRGRVFHASTPASFQVWLTGAAWHVSRYFAAEQRFVFINAWNEWAEGAYLEPDRRFGYAYLAAVRNVVQTFNVGPEQLQKLVAGFAVQHCTTCGTAAERGAESKQRDRTGVIGAISQACSEPVSA